MPEDDTEFGKQNNCDILSEVEAVLQGDFSTTTDTIKRLKNVDSDVRDLFLNKLLIAFSQAVRQGNLAVQENYTGHELEVVSYLEICIRDAEKIVTDITATAFSLAGNSLYSYYCFQQEQPAEAEKVKDYFRKRVLDSNVSVNEEYETKYRPAKVLNDYLYNSVIDNLSKRFTKEKSIECILESDRFKSLKDDSPENISTTYYNALFQEMVLYCVYRSSVLDLSKKFDLSQDATNRLLLFEFRHRGLSYYRTQYELLNLFNKIIYVVNLYNELQPESTDKLKEIKKKAEQLKKIIANHHKHDYEAIVERCKRNDATLSQNITSKQMIELVAYDPKNKAVVKWVRKNIKFGELSKEDRTLYVLALKIKNGYRAEVGWEDYWSARVEQSIPRTSLRKKRKKKRRSTLQSKQVRISSRHKKELLSAAKKRDKTNAQRKLQTISSPSSFFNPVQKSNSSLVSPKPLDFKHFFEHCNDPHLLAETPGQTKKAYTSYKILNHKPGQHVVQFHTTHLTDADVSKDEKVQAKITIYQAKNTYRLSSSTVSAFEKAGKIARELFGHDQLSLDALRDVQKREKAYIGLRRAGISPVDHGFSEKKVQELERQVVAPQSNLPPDPKALQQALSGVSPPMFGASAG